MTSQVLEINKYNEATESFEPISVKTSVKAVDVSDYETLDEKLEEIDNRLDGLSPFTISEVPPEDPASGQLWFKPLPIEEDPE